MHQKNFTSCKYMSDIEGQAKSELININTTVLFQCFRYIYIYFSIADKKWTLQDVWWLSFIKDEGKWNVILSPSLFLWSRAWIRIKICICQWIIIKYSLIFPRLNSISVNLRVQYLLLLILLPSHVIFPCAYSWTLFWRYSSTHQFFYWSDPIHQDRMKIAILRFLFDHFSKLFQCRVIIPPE